MGDLKNALKKMNHYERFFFWYFFAVGILLPIFAIVLFFITYNFSWLVGFPLGIVAFTVSMFLGQKKLKEVKKK